MTKLEWMPRCSASQLPYGCRSSGAAAKLQVGVGPGFACWAGVLALVWPGLPFLVQPSMSKRFPAPAGCICKALQPPCAAKQSGPAPSSTS